MEANFRCEIMEMDILYFGPLKRRNAYETKEDGSFYTYTRYRVAIAEDCNNRCVYCDIPEDLVGGREAMEMDHFRPWQKKFGKSEEKKFEHLKNEPSNLVHACCVCNGFKLAFWPTEDPDLPYDHEKGWIEPFNECRSDFLKVSSDGTVLAIKAPAAYQIKQLRLNRPLLRRLREHQILKKRVQVWISEKKPKWERIVKEESGTRGAQVAKEALEMLSLIETALDA